MKKSLFSLSLVVFIMVFISMTSNAQKMEFQSGITLKAKKVEKTRGGENPNITQRDPMKDIAIPAPKTKGGTDAGDCGCEITFDDYTGLNVEVYYNGEYRATVGAWQKAQITTNSGEQKIYLVTTGGIYEWQVDTGTCKGKYTWKISK